MDADLTRRLIDLACAMQQIPAPTFDEGRRAEFVRAQFEALGLTDVAVDDLGNVHGRRPGGDAAPLLVTAHTDTVFPAGTQLTLERTAERVSGPGIGDNSLGVAGLCALVWALEGQALPGDLCLAANVGEEGLGDLRGMRRVMELYRAQVEAVIVVEGMALGHIHHAGIGVRRYRITARAEGGHSYLHFGRESAIHALVRLGARLANLNVPASPKTTFNIGTIAGGTSINTIAREAALDLDLRSEDPATLAALTAHVEALAAAAAGPEIEIEISVIGNRPPGSIPRHHPLVQAAIRAYEAAGIADCTFEASSTDANIPLSLGVPAVCVGLARGGNAHRPDEYIETRELSQGLQGLVNLVQRAFAL